MDPILYYAVVLSAFLFAFLLIYLSAREVTTTVKAHRKLHLAIDRYVADPRHFDEISHMMIYIRPNLPNLIALKWADVFICTIMHDEGFSHEEREIILRGLRQDNVNGRWNLVQKFFLHTSG